MSDPTGTQAGHPMLVVLPPPRSVQSAADPTGTEATHPIVTPLPPAREAAA